MNRFRLITLIAVFGVPLAVDAQTAPVSCTNATLNGTYYLVLTGRNLSGGNSLTAVSQSVGTASFDGGGNVTFTLVSNTNLLEGVNQALSGTYSLPANCVGTLNLRVGDNAAFTLIPYNSGANFTITGQDTTYALTGSGGPMPPACITSVLSGSYAFSGSGDSLNSMAVSGVNAISGLMQFDGRGGVSGTWAIATNGSSTTTAVSGKYTLSAACQGTATVTDANGTSWNAAIVLTSANGNNFTIDASNPSTEFSASAHSTFTNPGLAVANAASSVGAGTPAGSIFALYGETLAASTAQATKVPLPGTIGGTSVTVNGETAPLFYVSSGQINAQMPWDAPAGLANIVVTTSTGTSNTVAVTIPSTAVPGVFPQYPTTQAVVADVHNQLNTPASPAKVGDTLVAYFTGGGPVTPAGPLVTGAYSPVGLNPITETTNTGVTVAGVAATVNYIGLTGDLVGVYQANFVVPKVGAGQRTLVITINGKASVATQISISQ